MRTKVTTEEIVDSVQEALTLLAGDGFFEIYVSSTGQSMHGYVGGTSTNYGLDSHIFKALTDMAIIRRDRSPNGIGIYSLVVEADTLHTRVLEAMAEVQREGVRIFFREDVLSMMRKLGWHGQVVEVVDQAGPEAYRQLMDDLETYLNERENDGRD